jgi:hypothetical protein
VLRRIGRQIFRAMRRFGENRIACEMGFTFSGSELKFDSTDGILCARKISIVEILSVVRNAHHAGRQTPLFHYALILVL